MSAEELLPQLEEAARKLGVAVSYERLHTSVGAGGLCRVRGQYRIIIDRRAGHHERVATLARALARFGTGGADLEPEVRDLLRRAGALHAS